MAEYIEHKAFLKDIEKRYCLPCKEAGKDHNGCMCRACWVDDMCGDVIDAPAADVAPVVRCKDCASTRKKDDYESVYLCDEVLICTNSEYGWQPVGPNHFCGYGCPRDGDGDAKES